MPQVPMTGANFGAYGQSPISQGPGTGNLLMAAAIQSQDPARSMPEGPSRPRLPARALKRKELNPLKGK
jgi:hypothetical protein